VDLHPLAIGAAATAFAAACAFLYWRHVWFFRNPPRSPPPDEGILSPADGTVVYVRKVAADEPVISVKRGIQVRIPDILRGNLGGTCLVIGVFMSPFDVHYNRAPVDGRVVSVRHYPASGRNLHMSPMHLRTLFRRPPYHAGSLHIGRNERSVTRIEGHYAGRPLPCYVVQIAGGSVRGIDSYVTERQSVQRGAVFGMIRVGSQVDTILPWMDGMEIRIQPGQKVRAGETLLVT
jgi:phosphatidylserine decarboxylase